MDGSGEVEWKLCCGKRVEEGLKMGGVMLGWKKGEGGRGGKEKKRLRSYATVIEKIENS